MEDHKNEKLFFYVNGCKFNDLYDFANAKKEVIVDGCDHFIYPIKPKLKNKNNSNRKGALVEVNNIKIVLFRHGVKVYAITDKCPHAGGPLQVGDIEDLPNKSICVRCPYHGFKFDLTTGECKHPGAHPKLKAAVYPVQVNYTTGELAVGFEEFSSSYFKDSLF